MNNIADDLHRAYSDGFKQGQKDAQPENEKRTSETAQNVPNGDLISRKRAIDALLELVEARRTWVSIEDARKEISGIDASMCAIHELPSAQPKIIRCKDCKHWDGVDTCDVIDAPVWDNDFCSMAERRSNE